MRVVLMLLVFYVMFKKRVGVFYRVFDPIKHVLRVF